MVTQESVFTEYEMYQKLHVRTLSSLFYKKYSREKNLSRIVHFTMNLQKEQVVLWTWISKKRCKLYLTPRLLCQNCSKSVIGGTRIISQNGHFHSSCEMSIMFTHVPVTKYILRAIHGAWLPANLAQKILTLLHQLAWMSRNVSWIPPSD